MFGQIETLLASALMQNFDRSEQISYLVRFSAGRHLVAVRYCLRVFVQVLILFWMSMKFLSLKCWKNFYPLDGKQRTQFVAVRQTFELTKCWFNKGHIAATWILASSRWQRSLLSLSIKALLKRFFLKSWKIKKTKLGKIIRLSNASIRIFKIFL